MEESMISARPILLFLTILTLANISGAANMSNLTGTYTLGQPAATGHDVQLMISLNIANHTAAEIGNATVSLQEPAQEDISYGKITGVSIASKGKAQITGSFTVPKELFDSWRKGSTPAMSITWEDVNGSAVKMFIQF
jgi:hypothetical protein